MKTPFVRAAVAVAISLAAGASVQAAPSQEEINQLGASLTPVGAEKAASKDGNIPAWDGGLCKPPASYKPRDGKGGMPYADPYPSDKPLYSVTSANIAQHADKLSMGTQEIFRRNPQTFRIDVYPTRRSVCLPGWVYENTKAKAASPKLVGNNLGVSGAHAQIPFPIPKSGNEAMWNLLLAYAPVNERAEVVAYYWDTSGNRILSFLNEQAFMRPYWDRTKPFNEETPYGRTFTYNVKPVAQYGNALLLAGFPRADLKDSEVWSYVPGQRRVRLAPELRYDTVIGPTTPFFSDEFQGFAGRMDKFDFKLVGKKEMLIPYNNYRQLQPIEQVTTARHPNPDTDRWELHRVWVVEATLKAGERHVQKRKVFYLDEDSWRLSMYDGFDQRDKIQRASLYPILQRYDVQTAQTLSEQFYDFNKGTWFMTSPLGDKNQGPRVVEGFPANYFTPDAMARNATR